MVMALLFTLLLFSVIFAWFGYRDVCIYLFIAGYCFGVGLFFHHMTDTIGLSL